MRWSRKGQSGDVIDRRGEGGVSPMASLAPLLLKGGIPGLLIVVVLLLVVPNLGGDGGPTASSVVSPQEDERAQFVSFVLDDVQSTWTDIFRRSGRTYERAKLVLFRDSVSSACGVAGSDVGPFYCPLDSYAYLDLGFFDQLDRDFGAAGDFAQAYVLAHEIGHHVQNLLGTDDAVDRLSQQEPSQENELSVRQELQADCYAGVWAHSTSQRGLLESGDVDEALTAARAVGDDRIQSKTTGRIDPDTWTHGSAEQRSQWFRRGLDSGDMGACDTFSGQI